MDQEPRICSYENSSYRTDFWEGQGREYEDLAERIALRRMLPEKGSRLLDIGAGFGRLSEFYERYEQVVLLDYSQSLLRQAQERLGRDGKFVYVAASFYSMPFARNAFDTAMMIRVMHHVEDVPALLEQVSGALAGEGCYVLEFASKRHLKAILRYALRRQTWSPFDQEPYEFVEMNYDFHPTWMRERLSEAMFHVKRQRTLSHFRIPLLKQVVPARLLATMDGICQPTGEWWQLTPSIFVQCAVEKSASRNHRLFRCLNCGHEDLGETREAMTCRSCGGNWRIDDGIHNFKAAIPV